MTHLTDDTIRALMEAATEGPWSCYDRQSGRILSVCIGPIAYGRRPCIVDSGGFDSTDLPKRENRANARLIALAPDLAAECLARGARIAELETQAAYDRDLIVDVRAALLKAQELIIPTETLERWSDGMTIFSQTALDIRNEVDAIIAQRENRNGHHTPRPIRR